MGVTCPIRVADGGGIIRCGEPVGHGPPHHGDGVSWTLPGEPALPYIPVAYPTSISVPDIVQAVEDALARGVTAEQITEAIRGLKPGSQPDHVI